MKIDLPFLNREKQKAVALGLEGQYVLVHFNPFYKGVKIPEFLLDKPSVTLKLSYYFKRVLHVTPEKITAELLFGDMYFTCLIPYEAIWGVAKEGEDLMIWPSSVPSDVAKLLNLSSGLGKIEKEVAAGCDDAPISTDIQAAAPKRAVKMKVVDSKKDTEVEKKTTKKRSVKNPKAAKAVEATKKSSERPKLTRVK